MPIFYLHFVQFILIAFIAPIVAVDNIRTEAEQSETGEDQGTMHDDAVNNNSANDETGEEDAEDDEVPRKSVLMAVPKFLPEYGKMLTPYPIDLHGYAMQYPIT